AVEPKIQPIRLIVKIDTNRMNLLQFVQNVLKVLFIRNLIVENVIQLSQTVQIAPNIILVEPTIHLMAGPCAVESYEQTKATATAVAQAGGRILRGGAFKPRTSPYSFHGLGIEGLEILRQVADELGLLVIT